MSLVELTADRQLELARPQLEARFYMGEVLEYQGADGHAHDRFSAMCDDLLRDDVDRLVLPLVRPNGDVLICWTTRLGIRMLLATRPADASTEGPWQQLSHVKTRDWSEFCKVANI